MAKIKKIDPKKVAKMAISEVIANALVAAGYKVNTDNEEFGFTAGTLVVDMETTDVQVKFIAPKSGLTHYAVLEDEVEVEAPAEVTEAPAEVTEVTGEMSTEDSVVADVLGDIANM